MSTNHLNTDPARFAELGYCLFPDVLTAAEAGDLREMLEEALATPLPQPSDSALDRDSYVGEPHVRDLRWLEICRHPRVIDAVESILGPNLILVYSSVFIKQPGSPVKVGWHQDNTYWPSVHGTDVVTLWLAVDAADADNSAMRVIPGSHRGWRELETVDSGDDQMLRRSVPVSPEQEASAATLEMGAGSLSIHDSFILHGSDANHSGRRRAGYTVRYCSTDTAWVDVDRHPHRVFVVRGRAGSRGDGYTNLLPGVEATAGMMSWS